MKILATALLSALVFVAPVDPEPSIPYFTSVRDVTIATPDHQNYLVVDTDVWAHARPDLADLRLYDGTNQVPYELKTELAGTSSQEAEAKILNLARRGDHTEFDLDVAPVTEYNRIHLTLDHKDFLVTASAEGRDALVGATAAPWPSPSTLFDFTRENLGSNSTIPLPTWSFRYIHVRLSPGILPNEVKRATVAHLEEKTALWTDAGTCRVADPQKRSTVITCDVPPKTPMDRVQFDVAAARVNFRRAVSVVDEKGVQFAAGSISRIRMNRGGTTVDSEDLAVNVFGDRDRAGRFTVSIDNGDDQPLTFNAIRPQSLEQRLYFEPQGRANLKLYYGDEKLAAPVYDYAKFFHEDAGAAQAQLGPDTQNTAFAGRADNRPWSERHKAVLWLAMLVAVAVLTLLAVRGLRTDPGTGN
jgi:Protein of unknown function (DUF3999)